MSIIDTLAVLSQRKMNQNSIKVEYVCQVELKPAVKPTKSVNKLAVLSAKTLREGGMAWNEMAVKSGQLTKLQQINKHFKKQVDSVDTLAVLAGKTIREGTNVFYKEEEVANGLETMSLTEEKGEEVLSMDDENLKRSGYLSWDEYFMAVSFLSALRSKDPNTQVGACIVSNEHKIVGIGYNGMPRGCHDDSLPWGRAAEDPLDTKYMYVCHAEMNAILNKNCSSVDGCVIYVALFPCNECAKMIIQSGIKEVIYFSDKHASQPSTVAAKRLLSLAGISMRQFIPRMKKITIDFAQIDPTIFTQT